MRNYNYTEYYSHAQNTTALQPNVFVTAAHTLQAEEGLLPPV
jgi:hypothetical protein